MKNGSRRVLRVAFTNRGIYLIVALNLCFVAYMVGQVPFEGHGVASCVAPKDEAFACYFPPPPPLWKTAGVVLNYPPLLASDFLSERVEGAYPQLCGLMTFFNLLILVVGVWLQWTVAGMAIGFVIKAVRGKLRRT
jgi:hypothetical protein